MSSQLLDLQKQEASLTKLLATKDIEIDVLNQHKSKLLQSEQALSSVLEKTTRELQEKTRMIEDFRSEVQGLAGIDVQFTVLRDGTGGYSQGQQSQRTARDGKIQKTVSYLSGDQSVREQSVSFLEMTPSVHSYVQAIGQTRLIDKFLKNDHQQKKEIKQLKHSYEKLE